jgi:hypothetical protein
MSTPPPAAPPTLLTLPPEIRNAIYAYVFPSNPDLTTLPKYYDPSSPIASALQLPTTSHFHSQGRVQPPPIPLSTYLLPLLGCWQIYTEAHLLALSRSTFHLSSTLALPDHFDLASRPLAMTKLSAIKHLTLTAKISHLRALNETWAGLPFGHPSLKLDTLTIIPQRPDASHSAYAHIADLSQSHTLAYVFGETLKNLKNVSVLTVVNAGCFKDGVFEICYRSLVCRMSRWGGPCCGVKFAEGGCTGTLGYGGEESRGHAWFKVFLGEGHGDNGREAGQEICRLLGVEGMDPTEVMTAGVGP